MTTSNGKATKEGTKLSDSEVAKRLLNEAMNRPGVRELTEVYEQARRFQEAAAGYRAALCPEPEEWASASSAPSDH